MPLSFNNKLYEQIDGVSMGGSLGPLLANTIMTKCEKVILEKLRNEKVIIFYTRHVDNTLLVLGKEISIMFQISSIVLMRTWSLPSTHLKTVFHTSLILKFVQMDLVFIINVPKLVNMYTLPLIHYGDGKLLGSVH